MVKLIAITQPPKGEMIIITGVYGSRRARHDNPVEVGMAVLEMVLGQPVNPVPASCALHEWEKNNAAK